MNIRTKARLAAVAGLAVIGVIAATIWWANAKVNDANFQRRQATEIVRALSNLRIVTFEYVLHRHERARVQVNAVTQRLDRLIESYPFPDLMQQEILASLRVSRAMAQRVFAELVLTASAEQAAAPENETIQGLVSQINSQLLIIQKDNLTDASRLSDLATEEIISAQRQVIWVILVGLLLIAVIMAGSTWHIIHNVLMPIIRLQQATREVTAGNLDFRLGIYDINEIGDLSKNFDAMTRQLQVSDGALRSEAAERKKASDALQIAARDLARSNTELAQFAYVASHDLQEPLRMVTGYIQLLEKRLADKLDSDTREFMGFAVDGAQRMQKLIEGILAYSRVGSRGLPFDPVDSAAALDEALLLLATPIANTHAEVSAQALPVVNVDRTQLVQLFQNLVGNALKYCRAPIPQVQIVAQRAGKFWRFSVSDNGIGIEPQYYERIFGIFQRLHTRREFPGTGIGLAISKCIVERHGGQIGVEAAPGGGTVFWFTLPEEKST